MPKKQKPNPLTSPATPKQIRKEARGATKAQYGPLRREVKAEQRASKLQQKRIGQEFGHYDTALDKAAATTTGAYGAAGSQIAATSTQAADYAETLRQRLQKEATTDATTRGATPDQTGSQTLAAATLARLNASNVLSGVTASQGATASAYVADKKRIGGREEIEQKLRESQRRRSYDADLRDIAKDAGAYKVAKKAEITDRERDFLLAQQAAHLNKKGQKIDARQTAASQAETRRHNLTAEQISAQQAATSARNAGTSARGQRSLARDRRGDNRRARQQERYDRRHPEAADEPNAIDQADVDQAEAIIRSLKPSFRNKATRRQLIDTIMLKDQTISREEAIKAYGKLKQR